MAILVFFAWTVTSFLCHKLAKMALVSYDHNTSLPPLLAPVLVTVCQVLCCYVTVGRTLNMSGLFLVMAVSHTAATLATNTSLHLMFADSTMAVKLLEPVTSAILQTCILQTSLSAEALVSMPAIVAGAILFVGDPFHDRAVTSGVVLAFFSNLILGIRNTAMKLAQTDHDLQFKIYVKYVVGLAVGVLAFLAVIHVSQVAGPLSNFLALAFASGACHVMYSYLSTCVVLQHMSVVGHAVANILKRVVVVLLLHASGRRRASLWNWVGLVVCTCGLVLYNRQKLCSPATPSSPLLASRSQQKTEAEIRNSRPASRRVAVLNLLLFISLVTYGAFHASHEWKTTVSVPLTARSINSLSSVSSVSSIIGTPVSSTTDTHVTNKNLMSRVWHVNPPKPKNKTGNFAKDLRHGFVNWRDGKPLITAPVVYQPEQKSLSAISDFLSRKPVEMPDETDGLSPYLRTSREIIAEAMRIHQSLLPDLIGNKKYAILIGAAAFENKGDPAMTIGELIMLEKLHIELLYYIRVGDCNDAHYNRAKKILKPYDPKDVVILMHGGGNLIGYKTESDCRGKAFKVFPGYKYFIFSQSFYMSGSKANVDQMVGLSCCNPNLTILLRDRLSLLMAKRLFNNGTRLFLAPDMAFAFGAVARYSPPFYDVLWLKRKDGEKPQYASLPSFPPDVSVHVADWWGWTSPKGNTTLETAHNMMMNGLLFLQRGRVVVTDRLHGHILSTLLDIPHVLLDNADNKLSSFHNTWTRGLENARLTDSPKEAVRLALELLSTYNATLPRKMKGSRHDE